MNKKQFDQILVVDDSSANLQLLMKQLTEQGYTVYPASDGELALEFVQTSLPDLILLDIRLPGMDGYEVCRQLKASERTRSIPVVFLSALEDEHDKVKGFQVGGVDYITKPFQPEEMLARIRIHLRIRELTEGLEQEVNLRTKELMIANRQLQQEIEEHNKAEEALRESRKRLNNILDNSPSAIYRCANDEHWTMEFISAGIKRITGYDAEDFHNNRIRSFASIIHPDDRQSVVESVSSSLTSKQQFEMDYRLIAADNTIRWVHEQGRGFFKPDGSLYCLDGAIFDITSQRQAEELVKLNAERMEALLQLNQMTDASEIELMRFAYEAAIRLTRSKLGYLGLMNDDETILKVQFWSQEAMAVCNVTGTPLDFPMESAGLWGEAVRQRQPIITNDYSAPNKWKKGTPEGHVKLIRHMNLPLIVADKIVMLAGVGNKEEDYNQTDVKQLSLLIEGMWRLIERNRAEKERKRYHNRLEETVKQRTEELILSRDAAEAANKAKSIFLANMSHELRTPLNAILGFSSIVRKDPQLPETQWQNLDIINRSGEHLLTLINDVLEMAKIEAGGVSLTTAPFDLGDMVRDVTDMMKMRAKEKGLQLQIDQSSKFPRYIVGDEPRMRQVLINLIGNAIKYTVQGQVAVRMATKQNDTEELLIEIEDSGPGIALDDQPRIFEPFVQLGDNGVTKGTGLGLTITHQYVQMMEGTIQLESEPGKGSLFRIELPLTEATEAEIFKSRQATTGKVIGIAPGQRQVRILIVEDQVDNQALLSHLIQSVGLQFKVAENGVKGVEIFQSWQPDLIFMDRLMPEMNGEEATRRIRQIAEGQQVKIVAVTASAFKEQRKQMLDAGMDDVVGKPYRSEEIYACLSKQLGLKFQYETLDESEDQIGTLTAEMFTILPESLRNELQAALQSLERDRIDQAISRVGEHDLVLQRTLARFVEGYNYPAILRLLSKEQMT